MKLDVDHLDDDTMHFMLQECPGPFLVEWGAGMTLQADSIVELINGTFFFAVGADRITLARADITRIVPSLP